MKAASALRLWAVALSGFCLLPALPAQQPQPPVPPQPIVNGRAVLPPPLPRGPGAPAPTRPALPAAAPAPAPAPGAPSPFGSPSRRAAPPAPAPTAASSPVFPPAAPGSPAATAGVDGDLWIVDFHAVPVTDVMDRYGELTGKRVLHDPRLENATVTVVTPGQLTAAKAKEFIEKQLLLAGYAIVPSGDDMVKIIAAENGRIPSTERVDMYESEKDLPKVDTVVNFMLPLQFIKAEDAAQAFSQIIPLHPYGKMMPVPNARAIVITENSNTIRGIIDLARQVDLPPTETITRTFHLQRADADDVAQSLGTLLGLESGSSSSSGSGGSRGANPMTRAPQPTAPGVPGGAAAANPVVLTLGGAQGDAPPPKITSIPRLNNILVIARPLDIKFIESLISEFDAESPTRSFIARRIRFLDTDDFLNTARNALLRGAPDKSGGGASGTGSSSGTKTTTSSGGKSSSSSSSGGLSSGFGGSSYGGGLNGMTGTSGGLGLGAGSTPGSDSGSTGSLDEGSPPKSDSILIGKTVVIVDGPNNMFYASGPPDQLRVLDELLDALDKRPQQVVISAVIAQYTLDDSNSFGIDWVQTLQNVGTNGAIAGASKTSSGTTSAINNLSNLTTPLSMNPLQGLTVYGQINKNLYGFLTALQSSQRFHVLQKPYVSTINHKKAVISIGQDLAIPGQSLTTAVGATTTTNLGTSVATTTQYIPVRLQLEVIPHVFDNHELRLEFNQHNNSVSGYTNISGNQVPNLSTQEMRNTLVVPDGATVLLGGLISTQVTENKSGVPILSSIPLIKNLFTSTTKTTDRQELMIFVTPHIVDDGIKLIDQDRELEKQNQTFGKAQRFAQPGDYTPILPHPGWNSTSGPPPRAEIVEPAPTSGAPGFILHESGK